MTSAVNQISGNVRNYELRNVPAAATAIFTAKKDPLSTVIDINVSNKDAGIKKVTVQVYRAANATSYSIATNYPIAIGGAYTRDLPIKLLEGDELRFTAETADTLDVVVAVSEGIGRGGA